MHPCTEVECSYDELTLISLCYHIVTSTVREVRSRVSRETNLEILLWIFFSCCSYKTGTKKLKCPVVAEGSVFQRLYMLRFLCPKELILETTCHLHAKLQGGFHQINLDFENAEVMTIT